MKYMSLILILLTACGPRGESGPQGPPGQNSEVAIVQLCPGNPQPHVFVEVAICIEDRLYAVYSKHGGFLTYLPNGRYASHGIRSRCNFIVSGCKVQ